MTSRIIIISIIFSFIHPLTAQKLSGSAVYQTAATIQLDLDSTRFTPEDMKRIKERMKSATDKEFVLNFNAKSSIYEESEKLEQGQGRGGMWMSMMIGGDGITYKNVMTQELLKQTEFYGKMFLIVDTLKDYKWKLGKETKMIGSYTCYKATTEQEVIMRRFGPPRGDKDRSADTVQAEIVAWYSPQIPLSFGPSGYWGLPGLIMEINTPNLKILCTKIELKPNVESTIAKPKKGEVVTQKEYEVIVKNKMEEMKKMYGGGQRGKGRY